MHTAIYPGSFDPITLGHLNIIRRASKMFDKVMVCVMVNAGKTPMFSLEERLDHVRRVTERFPNVEVDMWNGLLVEYADRFEQPVIVRGLRALSDFEYEFQMAMINRQMNKQVETVFFAASEKYTYLSSSAVKEMARYGADISGYVPFEILDEVRERAGHKNTVE